jgi:hypothetical protein
MNLNSDKEHHREEVDEPQKELPHSERFLPILPREVTLITLGFLKSNDLKKVALVNKEGHALSSAVRIKRFQQRLENSTLWRCLPSLVNNSPGEGEKSFIAFVRSALGLQFLLVDSWALKNNTCSAFLRNWIIKFPNTLEQLGFQITSPADIQAKAQSLLRMVCSEEKIACFEDCSTLSACMDLVGDPLKITAWQLYDELDQLFSCLILFIAASRSTNQNRFWLIAESPLNRGLTGSGLITLEASFPTIYYRLVMEAIRIHGLAQPTDAETRRITEIESLLARVTEADNLRYIELEQLPVHIFHPMAPTPQRKIFIEVLRKNYEFMFEKMTLAVLLRLEFSPEKFRDFNQLFVIPHVLKNVFLLKKLNAKGLVAILTKVDNNELPKVIQDNPHLYSFITFEVIAGLVNTKLPGIIIVFFLTQPEILGKLDHDQIVTLAKHLVYTEFDKVLESPAFQDMLAKDPCRNKLLMKLSQTEGKCFLSEEIAKNPYASSLLTVSEIMLLIENDISVYKPFAKNDVVLNKLNSQQLLTFFKKTPNKKNLIAKNRLDKFTNNDLVLLVQNAICTLPQFMWTTDQLIEALPSELIRRAASGGPDGQKMTSNHWFSLACSHTELGLFIADHYLDQLWENHLVDLRTFYYAKKVDLIQELYYKNSQVASSVDCVSNYQHIIVLAHTAWLSKQLTVHCQPVDDYPSSRSSVPYRTSPSFTETDTQATTGKTGAGTQWYNRLIKIFLLFLLIVAIALVCTGIGSAMGLTVASVVTDFLFASLPFSSSLASCLVGLLFYGVGTSFWLVFDTDNDIKPDNHSSPAKDNKEKKFTLEPFISIRVSSEKQDQLRYQVDSAHIKNDIDDSAESMKPGLF